MKESWKPVPIDSIKDTHEISNFGLVRLQETKEILPRNIRSGYLNLVYNISENNKKNIIKNSKIHRLVAKAFIENDDPENKTWVNHINGDKTDCSVINLEWVTPDNNVQHAMDTELIKPLKRAVVQYDIKTNKIIKMYNSIIDASNETGISVGQICSVCTGFLKHARGYGWRYLEDNPNAVDDVNLSEFKQISGFPNYVLNEDGQIYSLSHKKFLKYQKHQEGCLMVQLTNQGKRKDFLAHRLVGSYFIKKDDPKHNSIRHIDGNKTNNHIDNLKWCYVPGVEMPEIHFDMPYYNPKTAIKTPKRKSTKSGPKDLLTTNRHCLSVKQRAERKRLLEKKRQQNSGSKTTKPKQKKILKNIEK